jgi:hypothetical protein
MRKLLLSLVFSLGAMLASVAPVLAGSIGPTP